MTTPRDDTGMDRDDTIDTDLQARLRALRGDVDPGRDLWPGIAAAIAAQPVEADAEAGPVHTAAIALPRSATTRHHGRRPRRRRAWVGWSAAASLALAVALGWSLRPAATGDAGPAPTLADAPVATSPSAMPTVAMPPSPPGAATGAPQLAVADASSLPILLRQADAMAREYAGAVREIEASRGAVPANPALAGAAADLDRSAAEIRQALAQSPGSRFLVERLQRVYAQRLALARHAAIA